MNITQQIRKYQNQIRKMKTELTALEEKKRQMVAEADSQIVSKQNEIMAMEKSLAKVNRLQNQIARELGMEDSEKVNKKQRQADPVEVPDDGQPEEEMVEFKDPLGQESVMFPDFHI